MLNDNQTITISQDRALADALLICRFLDKSGLQYKPLWVDTRQAFIVLVGYNLPYCSALDALRDLHLDIAVISLTGSAIEEDAVTCIKNGDIDYLLNVLNDHLPKLAEAVENDCSIQKP